MGEQRTFPASPVAEVESGDQKIADVDRPGAEPRPRIEETRRSVRVDIEVAEVHVAMVDNARLRSSEERRVGTECVSPCQSRWAAAHSKVYVTLIFCG